VLGVAREERIVVVEAARAAGEHTRVGRGRWSCGPRRRRWGGRLGAQRGWLRSWWLGAQRGWLGAQRGWLGAGRRWGRRLGDRRRFGAWWFGSQRRRLGDRW